MAGQSNGYVESFNGKLRDELLDREIFYTVTEAKISNGGREYHTVRPQSALGYRRPRRRRSNATIGGLTMNFALS